jgi:putative heme-binding domain-containing protein
MENVRKDAVANLSEAQKQELAGVIKGTQSVEVVRDAKPRQFVHNWQMEDLVPALGEAGRGRSFENGRAALEAAQCLKCHRFNGEGASTGPDLSGVGNRFNERDLLESIVLPSKVISDQYQSTRIVTRNDVLVGQIVKDDPDTLQIRTNPLAAGTITVKKADVKDRRPDKLSMMPEGLISILRKDEVLDLLAYLRSGGKPDDRAFAK